MDSCITIVLCRVTMEYEDTANLCQDIPPRSPVRLLPKTYQPSHQRDDSDSSSIYSERRHSVLDHESNRVSMVAPLPTKDENRKTLLPPGATTENRYSDIYDAYYRQSMINANSSSQPEGETRHAESKTSAGLAM